MKRFGKKTDIPEQFRPKSEEGHSPIPNHHDESNWLVSYADMMTLLCGFFIMLFSVAHLDPPKYEEVKKEVAKQFGGQYQPPQTEALAQAMEQVVKKAGIADKATVRHDNFGVTVVFRSTVFFDTMSADVKPEGDLILDGLIQEVAAQEETDKKHYRIVVEGHTDSKPIVGGPFPSNWELSAARSSRVVRMFLDKGFAPDHLTAVGYADTRPEFPSRTPAGTWDEDALAKNRRVVLRILDPSTNAIPLDDGSGQTGVKLPNTAQTVPAVVPPVAVAPMAGPALGNQAPVVVAPIQISAPPVALPQPQNGLANTSAPRALVVRGASAGSARAPAMNGGGNSIMPTMIMGGAHKLGSPSAPEVK